MKAWTLVGPMLLCGAVMAQDVGFIDPSVARRRIAELTSVEKPGTEQIDALVALAERTIDPSLSSNAAYNAGTIALGLGDDRAESLLRKADRDAIDPALRAEARFNLAHAVYKAASTGTPPASPQEIDERIAGLTEAANLFRSVLDLAPDHTRAAANTERVRREIRALEKAREELERQQQMQQELADQLQRLAEQQQQQAEQTQGRAQQTDADSTQEPQESENKDAAESQNALSEQTQEARQRSEEAGASEEARDALDQAREAQRRATDAIENNDLEAAAEAQKKAAEALREAAERIRPEKSDTQEGDQTPQQDSVPQDNPQQGDQPPESDSPEITPLAKSLLEKERSERQQRMRYLQKTGRQRVERDW
ncbi:MAG: hypothetical protein D6692_00705 [Planctomycetota bacterium]|nr:MAG: hypothetical protein D6692_00705 [Planctomycetota bacterium]